MHTSIPGRAVRGLSLLLALLLASGCLVLTACRTASGDSATGTSGTGADTSADTESAAPDNTASTDTATGSGSEPAPETPGTEPVLLAEARKEGLAAERKRALAYAFAEKRMTQAEPLLLGWLGGADARTAEQIYNALAVCGSRASLKPLAAAAAGLLAAACVKDLSLIHI